MTEPNGKLLTNLRWFLDRLDRVPETIHIRGVWSDPQDGAGSKLGSKKTSRDFADFIEGSPKARRIERTEVQCFHVGVDRDGGEPCLACMAYDENGAPIGESGTRESVSEVYRWPMRAAIAKLATDNVQPGRPPLDVTLRTLARHHGDLQSSREVLARRWPVVGVEEEFYRHIWFALDRVKRVFREDAPPPRPERSEAQLDAENEGTRQVSLHDDFRSGNVDATSHCNPDRQCDAAPVLRSVGSRETTDRRSVDGATPKGDSLDG